MTTPLRISFACPSCQSALDAPAASAGLRRHCTGCRRPVTVPGQRVRLWRGAVDRPEPISAPLDPGPDPESVEKLSNVFLHYGILFQFVVAVDAALWSKPGQAAFSAVAFGAASVSTATGWGLRRGQPWAWYCAVVFTTLLFLICLAATPALVQDEPAGVVIALLMSGALAWFTLHDARRALRRRRRWPTAPTA